MLRVPVLLGDRGEIVSAAEDRGEVRDAPEVAQIGARAAHELVVGCEVREIDDRRRVSRAGEPGEHLLEPLAVPIDGEDPAARRCDGLGGGATDPPRGTRDDDAATIETCADVPPIAHRGQTPHAASVLGNRLSASGASRL